QEGGAIVVPEHLRDAHYAGAKTIGAGTQYLYPHDFPHHWVLQRYLPDGLTQGAVFQPGFEGREGLTVEQWRQRREQNGDAS
ncbi:MAG: recombinase RarA, partial [Actinomycetota bacterium]